MKIKTIILAVLLLLIINKGISQHLTYFDLLDLQSSSIEKCEDILGKKSFVLSDNKYDEESKETKLGWKYQNRGNEYFSKTCSSLFTGKCTLAEYIIESETYFKSLKNSLKSGFNIFTYSNTNSYGVLSHHYLIGNYKSIDKYKSREVVLYTFPIALTKTKVLFAISIDEVDIPVIEK